MNALLLPGSPPLSDPAAPSLLAALRERLPSGWEPVPATGRTAAWRHLPRAAALVFLGCDGACGPGRGRLAETVALTLAAQARACRVALLGVRAAPAGERLSSALAGALAARADLLVVADESSAVALVDAGVPAPLRVGTDPVWAAFAGAAPVVERRDAVVAVVGPRGPMPKLAASLRGLPSTGVEIAVQPWERDIGDAAHHAHALAAELGPDTEVLSPVADLVAARRRFAGARLVVAGSPHPLIAAAAAGTPFVATESGGATRIAQALAQLAATDGDLPRALHSALEAAPLSRAAIDAQIDAAEEGFRLLRLLLSEGEDGADEVHRGMRLAPEVWNT